MSEETTNGPTSDTVAAVDAAAASVAAPVETRETGYTPPTSAASNQDKTAQAGLEARLAALEAELAAARSAAAAAVPVVKSPEERVREALDGRGIGLGVDERLAELYAVVSLVAAKVGV